MRGPLSLAVVAACLVLPGCPDTTPSSGRCTGTFGGAAVDWALVPELSDFHRDDDIFGDEDGPFRIAYGPALEPTLTISGQFDDMPSAAYLGTHALPTSAVVYAFVEAPGSTAYFTTGTMTLTTSHRERVGGTLALSFDDGSALDCTMDLRRNYALDTDD